MSGTVSPAAKRRKLKPWQVSLLVSLCLIALWELLAYAFPTSAAEAGLGSPLIPGWGWIFTHAFPAIANYGGDGMGLSAAEGGPAGNYPGAIAAIAQHSVVTWGRLLGGLIGRAAFGIGLGVAISWSGIARMIFALPAHLLKTLPLLAMIPLFQIWFGVSEMGIWLFVTYGVSVIFFAGTINAISNVPPIFIENARTLGASSAHIYRSIIIPAILPELRTSLILSTGVAWSAVVGAEFLGAQNGLGYVEVQAQQFALLDRMFVIAIVFLIYASISFFVVDRLSRHFIRWADRGEPTASRV
ncbi:MAG: ABC transporter permease subunit [Phycisphaerales bacterium]|nr:ABC transporter permease subunit [Phycisphaerales bacterium]